MHSTLSICQTKTQELGVHEFALKVLQILQITSYRLQILFLESLYTFPRSNCLSLHSYALWYITCMLILFLRYKCWNHWRKHLLMFTWRPTWSEYIFSSYQFEYFVISVSLPEASETLSKTEQMNLAFRCTSEDLMILIISFSLSSTRMH